MNIRTPNPDPLNKLNPFYVQTNHSAQLTTDSGNYVYNVDFKPDKWIVVARLTAGYINCSPESGIGALSFRVNSGTIVLPNRSQVFTVQTVGATGFYDVYAIANLDGFEINS